MMDEVIRAFEKELQTGNFIILECDFDHQCYQTYLAKSLQLKKMLMKYEKLFDQEFLKVFNRLRDSITRAWRIYEKGDIRSAGNIIYNLLFSNKYFKQILCREFQSTAMVNTLYRGRIIKDFYTIDSLDEFIFQIFHIPFNKRNLVANERYSISGFPCLYLADSIDGVKVELGITDLSEDFFVGDFKVKKAFQCFDLTPSFLTRLSNLSLLEIKIAMLKLLLLMACSINVDHKKSNYCSNYVIPQLVTASIASKAKYSYRCIKYLSIKSYHHSRIAYNYVYIPEYQKDELYDRKLLDLFMIEPNKSYNIFSDSKELIRS